MKNIKKIITGITLLLTISTLAQLDKNTWLVGGSGSFDSYELKESTPNSQSTTYNYKAIEVSTKVGYFVMDKLVLGINPTYISVNGYSNSISSHGPNKYLIGVFSRYYLLNKDKPFNILTEVNYQVGKSYYGDFSDVAYTINRFTAQVGSEIFFNSSVGLEVLVGYKSINSINQKVVSPSDIYSYTPSYQQNGFQIAIGFQIHLKK